MSHRVRWIVFFVIVSLLLPVASIHANDATVYLSNTPPESKPDSEGDEVWLEWLLLREIVRQSFLIAAREEMGAATRDGTLREPIPELAGTPGRFDMQSRLIQHKGVRAAFQHDGQIVHEAWIEGDVGAFGFYVELAEQAERLSRTTFVELLQKHGIEPRPVQKLENDNIPDDVVTHLRQFNYVDQYLAVRKTHERIREKGESPEALAVLARGYANLYQLAIPFYGTQHKAFAARGLLYAQRLKARLPDSPVGLWHRAYVLTVIGLPRWADEDLRQAAALHAENDDVTVPSWVDLLHAYISYEYELLQHAAMTDGSDAQLAGMLWYASIENAQSPTLAMVTGRKVVDINRFNLRVLDGMMDHAGVDGLTEVAPRMHAELLRTRLAPWIRRDTAPASLRNLTPPMNVLSRKVFAEELVRESDTDRGEPSIAVLGRLVDEMNVTQVARRAYFLREKLDVDTSRYLDEVAAALKEHPYDNLIQTCRYARNAQRPRSQALVDGIPIHDTNMIAMMEMVRRLTVSRTPYGTHLQFFQKLGRHRDGIEADFSRLIWFNNSERIVTFATQMEELSVHSPTRHIALISHGWESIQEQLPEWEKRYGRHPGVALALASQYEKHGNDEKAHHYYEHCVDIMPDYNAHWALARYHHRQGDMTRWLETLEKFLQQEGYGLEHAYIRATIAETFMGAGEYERALPYAARAADSYSQWSLRTLRTCLEGLKRWDEAERLARAEVQRYGGSAVYHFLARTDRPGLDQAFNARLQGIAQRSGADHISILHNRIYYAWMKGDYPTALGISEERLARFGDNAIALLETAVIAELADDARKRDDYLRRTLAVELPADATAAQRQTHDERQACARWIQNLLATENPDLPALDRLCPDDSLNQHRLMRVFAGMVLLRHGHEASAREQLRRAAGDAEESFSRTLAIVELRRLGEDPSTIPLRHKNPWK